ncbi:MAG: hypothetical protein HY840_09585 [Bacteroidetes bacterium]|nr:hypothetical protein [Bacteroidota bacterium]
MEGFDDKEQKKLSKSLAAKLKLVREHMATLTPEKRAQIMEAIAQLEEQMSVLKEKQKLGTITEQEQKLMDNTVEKLIEVVSSMKDMQLLLYNAMEKKAIAYYHEMKKKAEAGDEKAKKIYKELKPLYQKMLKGIDN